MANKLVTSNNIISFFLDPTDISRFHVLVDGGGKFRPRGLALVCLVLENDLLKVLGSAAEAATAAAAINTQLNSCLFEKNNLYTSKTVGRQLVSDKTARLFLLSF